MGGAVHGGLRRGLGWVLSQIFLILLDVRIDGVAPGLRAEGVGVFVLRSLNG